MDIEKPEEKTSSPEEGQEVVEEVVQQTATDSAPDAQEAQAPPPAIEPVKEIVPVQESAPKPEPVTPLKESSPESESGSSIQDSALETAQETTEPVTEPEPTEQESQESTEQEQEDGPKIAQLTEEQAALPWYVVHTYSGFESRVKLGLEERIRSEGVNEKFGRIIVPEENVVELVRGEKKTSKKKFFPGYIVVQCQLDEETWHLVKDTPKVTGFIGDSVDPVPLSQEEVDNLMQQMEGGGARPRASVDFETGDAVKVVDGPFADFNGTVDDVKPDKGKLRVLISIFGRNTPVELDFVQVEKV